MARTRKVTNFSLNYVGLFSFKDLYKVTRDWVLENGYGPDKWLETLYLQRDGPAGQEHWIWWRTEKVIDNYFKFVFSIDFHTLTLQKTEIVHEGKKIKTNKGEVEVFFDMKLVMDHQNKLETSVFKHKWLKKQWLNKWGKSQIEDMEDIAEKDVYRLQGMIKQYLDLKGFLTEYTGEMFHPVKGMG